MKIAALQMEIREKSNAENISHGLQLVEAHAAKHDIIVLPEVWTTGYSLGHLSQESERIDSDNGVIGRLQKIAAADKCAVVAGSVACARYGKIYNTSVAIDATGAIVNLYDKVHLFGMFGEENFFAAGSNFDAYLMDGLCCASSICYDLRFPELFRRYALQGAQLMFCPAEWPTARGDVWRLLAQARAAENHVFFVAVNCVGSFKGESFFGHSMIIGPDGKILAEAGEKEEVLSCEIDLGQLDKVRDKLNVLRDVRRELNTL